MANPELTNRYEHAAQEVQATVNAMITEMERLRNINTYLGDKLQESHRFHSALILERDRYQVQYEVLREVTLTLVAARGWGEIETSFKRLREVLGLTEEAQEAQEPVENTTYDYQTGWAEDGPIPDEETSF